MSAPLTLELRSASAPDATPAPPAARRRPTPLSARRIGLYDLGLGGLTERLVALGQPAYRARQIYAGAYRQLADSYEAMTDLPRALRPSLAAELPIQLIERVELLEADDW